MRTLIYGRFIEKCGDLLTALVLGLGDPEHEEHGAEQREGGVAPEGALQPDVGLHVGEGFVETKVAQPSKSNSKWVQLTSHLKWKRYSKLFSMILGSRKAFSISSALLLLY